MTLLFADIHGSTEMIQHLDPERAAELLDPLVRSMEEIVGRYDGVSSAHGDGIMAMFGPPMLAEGHAIRACFAALDILERARADPAGPQVRIGLNSGDVLVKVGPGGKPRLDQIFGSAIHIAARLEQAGEPGTASISQSAFELVRHVIEAEPLASVKVKGIDEPVGRLRLVRRTDASRRRPALNHGLTYFVGRERERQQIQAAAQIEGPGVRIVQVLGEPGIGKSRLVQEFLGGTTATAAYVVLLIGSKLHTRVPYDAVSEWLGDVLDRPRVSVADARHVGVSGALANYRALTSVQRRTLEQLLGAATPKPVRTGDLVLGPALDVAAPLAATIRQQAGDRRVLVICEDIDHFDSASLRLLPGVLDALADRGVLAITTSRVRVPLTGETARVQQIRLGPLRDSEAREMLGSLRVPSLRNARRVKQLLTKAGGNPFFLEEVGALEMQDPAPRPETEGGIGVISDAVEALIVDRLQRLPDDRRQVLRVAAVVGLEIPVPLLERLTGLAADELRRLLFRLQADHLLCDLQGGPSPQIGFRHALTRDVAYRSLLRTQRQRLHAEVAFYLETENAEDPARRLEALCYHTAQGGLSAKAVDYLQQAAVLAAELGASSQADDYLRHALEIASSLSDLDDRRRRSIEILLSLRALALMTLRYHDALECVDEAAQLATQLGDETVVLQVRARRLRPLNALGRLEEAVQSGEELWRRSRGNRQSALAVETAHHLGQAYFHTGEFRRADATFSAVIEAAESVEVGSGVRAGGWPVLMLATRGAARAFLGQFSEAQADALAALDHATRHGRRYDLVYAGFIQGFVLLKRRRLDDAIASFRTTLEQAERHSVQEIVPSLQTGLGHALTLQSDQTPGLLSEAIAHLQAARTTTLDRQRATIHLWAVLTLAMAYSCQGADGPALQLSSEAVEMGRNFGLHGFLVLALRHRSLIQAAATPTDIAGARNDLAAALATARRLGMLPETAHVLVAAAMLEPNGASARLSLARRTLSAVGLDEWAARFAAVPGLRQAF